MLRCRTPESGRETRLPQAGHRRFDSGTAGGILAPKGITHPVLTRVDIVFAEFVAPDPGADPIPKPLPEKGLPAITGTMTGICVGAPTLFGDVPCGGFPRSHRHPSAPEILRLARPVRLVCAGPPPRRPRPARSRNAGFPGGRSARRRHEQPVSPERCTRSLPGSRPAPTGPTARQTECPSAGFHPTCRPAPGQAGCDLLL